MSPSLQQAFDKLEKQRALVLELTASLSPSQVHAAPPGKWSVSQILSHLVASEQLALQYMRKKMLGIEQAGNAGFAEKIKMLVLVLSQRLPLKYKAPGIIVKNTSENVSWEEIDRQWDLVRLELKALADSLSENNSRKKIFKHPVLGKFTLEQGFGFFYEHIRHHTPQIKRLLKRHSPGPHQPPVSW